MRKTKDTAPDPHTKIAGFERMFDSFWKIGGYFVATLIFGFGIGKYLEKEECSDITRDLIHAQDVEIQKLKDTYQDNKISELTELVKETKKAKVELEKRLSND